MSVIHLISGNDHRAAATELGVNFIPRADFGAVREFRSTVRDQVVVVVDDNPEAVKEKQWLGGYGAKEVIVFSNPLEALTRIPEIKPDVLLLDVEMPGLNGIELARQLLKSMSPEGPSHPAEKL